MEPKDDSSLPELPTPFVLLLPPWAAENIHLTDKVNKYCTLIKHVVKSTNGVLRLLLCYSSNSSDVAAPPGHCLSLCEVSLYYYIGFSVNLRWLSLIVPFNIDLYVHFRRGTYHCTLHCRLLELATRRGKSTAHWDGVQHVPSPFKLVIIIGTWSEYGD